MDIPKLRAIGRIEVTSYDSASYDDSGRLHNSEVNIVEEFSGGLVGVGSMRLILATETDGGAAHFTGMERVLGKLGDRSGSFIIQNSGTLTDGVLHSTWRGYSGIRYRAACRIMRRGWL